MSGLIAWVQIFQLWWTRGGSRACIAPRRHIPHKDLAPAVPADHRLHHMIMLLRHPRSTASLRLGEEVLDLLDQCVRPGNLEWPGLRDPAVRVETYEHARGVIGGQPEAVVGE